MKYVLLVKATEYSEAGITETTDEREAMSAYKKLLAKQGALLADESLHTSTTGMRITYPKVDGPPQILAGPFPINQDLIKDYLLINVKNEEEALSLALKMPVPKNRGTFEVELRKVKDDERASIQNPGIKALEANLQDQLTILKKF